MKRQIKRWVVFSVFAGTSFAYGSVFLAFEYNAGVVGQQPNGPWALGNDFTVNSAITVTALGAFDSGSDGVFASPVDVAIYNTDTGNLVTPVINFSTGSPGIAVGGSRLKDLPVSISLPAGFHGSIVGSNYGGGGGTEVNGNAFLQSPDWSFNSAGGALTLSAFGRYLTSTTSVFPTIQYSNGGNPLFAAGTFAFTVPEPVETATVVGLSLIAFGLGRKRH